MTRLRDADRQEHVDSASNKYHLTPGPQKRSHLQLPNSNRSIRKRDFEEEKEEMIR